MTQCTAQYELWKIGRRRVTVGLAGGSITSNAGVLLVSRIERQMRLCERFADALEDRRARERVQHTFADQMRQRVLQIACGYEDGNDATLLRHEAAFQTAMNRVAGAEGSALASQPTLSRLERRAPEEIARLNETMLAIWIERVRQERQIVLEIDSTDDETHGAQQLSFFQGHYGHTMYHPLLVFDGRGWPVAVMLRPGNAHGSAGAVDLLRQIVTRLPRRTRVLLRADAGFAIPSMYETCEELGVEYVIAQTVHEKYKAITVGMVERVAAQSGSTGQPARECMEFRYKARTWNRERRIVAKAEANAQNTCVRYVATNIERGTPEQIYDIYTGRGQSENYIKDLKNAVFGDRLSCSSFTSNCFRLILHTMTYMVLHELRTRLRDTELARAQMDTLRLRLLKIGASIMVTARRIWVRLSTNDPARPLFEQAIARVLAAPT
jgi:hypothetical protein